MEAQQKSSGCETSADQRSGYRDDEDLDSGDDEIPPDGQCSPEPKSSSPAKEDPAVNHLSDKLRDLELFGPVTTRSGRKRHWSPNQALEMRRLSVDPSRTIIMYPPRSVKMELLEAPLPLVQEPSKREPVPKKKILACRRPLRV